MDNDMGAFYFFGCRKQDTLGMKIRIAVGQINSTVGDLAGNADKILRFADEARAIKADIVCFPELAMTGYPPEDLLLKPGFIADNLSSMSKIAPLLKDIIAVIGFVDRAGGKLFNASAVVCGGKVAGIYHKMILPNYGVFDEKRYFAAGKDPFLFRAGRLVFGINICEDIW